MHSEDNPLNHSDLSDAKKSINVFLVAHSDIYVDGIIQLLSAEEVISVAGCQLPEEMDIDSLVNQGIDLLLVSNRCIHGSLKSYFREFKNAMPDVRILVFGMDMDDEDLVALVRAGVHGYINDNMTSQNLIDAVLKVSQGTFWVERHILELFVNDAVEMEKVIEDIVMAKIESFRDILTQRESDVFQFVLQGLSTREIAEELHLSEQSIKLHLGRLFKKFDVQNKTQLVLLVFEKVCPVSNMIRLFRMRLDKRRIDEGRRPLIDDPLDISPLADDA